jgi:hypothetical protein
MKKKERPSVDPKSYDLAEHFLSEIPGVTEDDIWELADTIQTACEDACREIELSEYEIRRKAAEKDSQGAAK